MCVLWRDVTKGCLRAWPYAKKIVSLHMPDAIDVQVITNVNTMKEKPRIIQLPKFPDTRGNLSFVEQMEQIPFVIRRVYWLYDVPGGEMRGGHAYFRNREFVVALSGSFDVVLDDGMERRTYSLNRSYYGLYVPNGYWREMNNFSTNSLALVLASTDYDERDYEFDYNRFRIRARHEAEQCF